MCSILGRGFAGPCLVFILVLLAALLLLLLLGFDTGFSGGGVSGANARQTAARGLGVEWADIIVLVDNNPGSRAGGLEAVWGLSLYVRTPHGSVLFDAGPDPGVLERNSRLLGVDPCSVDAIVVSHEHFDHIGGLKYMALHCPDKPVYVPRGASRGVIEWMRNIGLKRIILVNSTMQVAPGVFVVKPLYGPPWEEALAVNVSGKGLVVLVGCSHPGVVNIVREAREELGVNVYMVIGGFHTFTCSLEECRSVVEGLVGLGVEKIAPIHCSGDTLRRLVMQLYPDRYMGLGVGSSVRVASGKE